MKRILLTAVIGSLSLVACAQAPQSTSAATAAPAPVAKPASPADRAAEAKAREALKQLNPQLKIDYIGASPLPGFREVIVGGQVAYVSDDGKYLMQGQVLDLATRREITESSPGLASYRAGLIAAVPASQRIVFAPPNAKHTVSVFTDIECGYCRKLHNDIAEYNRQGIAVEYLAFPRMGLGSADHKNMVSVWCSANPKQALTEAKAGKPVPARTCDNPVAKEYELGQRVGVTGTPAIFSAGGVLLGGYVSPKQLRERLDALEGDKAGGAGGR